ncbi:hypothetical protein, partial [Acinetobacter bohemicus]|uniref:hypothetical protein n=1 Tax=Acinetobacter bohemicus TaxID=1435036 RepID=UPI000550F497
IPAGISQTVNLALAIGLISSMPDTDSGSKSVPREEQCERENHCGPYSRIQAYSVAQRMAHISREERYYRAVDGTSLNKSIQGLCYSSLRKVGAKHLGFGCEWQNSWIEDHPDKDHDCPHLHVYKKGISVGIVKYKRGSF